MKVNVTPHILFLLCEPDEAFSGTSVPHFVKYVLDLSFTSTFCALTSTYKSLCVYFNYCFSEKKQKIQLIKYPIDDSLLDQDEDQHLTERPSPCRDFNVPMDCAGDLLMVWDFCSSFSKLLNLFPFPLEDFESALCHKEGNVLMVTECHATLLRLLLKDNGAYSAATRSKKLKAKVCYNSIISL